MSYHLFMVTLTSVVDALQITYACRRSLVNERAVSQEASITSNCLYILISFLATPHLTCMLGALSLGWSIPQFDVSHSHLHVQICVLTCICAK